jgi:hypothetical protein
LLETIYLKQRRIDHYKLKIRILVRRSDFDEWMEQYRVDEGESLDTVVEDLLSAVRN